MKLRIEVKEDFLIAAVGAEPALKKRLKFLEVACWALLEAYGLDREPARMRVEVKNMRGGLFDINQFVSSDELLVQLGKYPRETTAQILAHEFAHARQAVDGKLGLSTFEGRTWRCYMGWAWSDRDIPHHDLDFLRIQRSIGLPLDEWGVVMANKTPWEIDADGQARRIYPAASRKIFGKSMEWDLRDERGDVPALAYRGNYLAEEGYEPPTIKPVDDIIPELRWAPARGGEGFWSPETKSP